MISATGLGYNPFRKVGLLRLRPQAAPPPPPPPPAWARRFWNRPAAAPPPPPPPSLAPPPPPPPPGALPAWAQRWAAFRQQPQQARPLTAREIAEIQAHPSTRTGAGHFNGYVDAFGRPMPHPHPARRPMPRPRHPIVRGGGGYVRSYYPEMVTMPVETIYMQPLPGCTVSPNPIPPCSGTLTWVDSRTVCCR